MAYPYSHLAKPPDLALISWYTPKANRPVKGLRHEPPLAALPLTSAMRGDSPCQPHDFYGEICR
jgi:hypothetical protein